MSFLKRGLLISLSTAMVAVLLLLLRASPVRAQVENLCIVELDAGDTSTTELCTADQPGCASANPACVSTGTNVDWNQIISAQPTPPGGAGPTVTSGYGSGGQASGVIPSQGDVFRSGTKILDPIASWQFSAGNSPSKATLTNGVVASYDYAGPSLGAPLNAPQTMDEIVYYALTRATNNGSELQGTWFLVKPLTPTPAGCTKGCSFIGAHTTGDTFVLSTFTGGGGEVGIAIFQWTGDDATGSLNFVKSAQCSGTNLACGVVNSGTVTNSSLGSLTTGLFYEGGIDLTQVFDIAGVAVPCFSNVLFESIASASCSPSSCSATNFTSASSLGNAEAKGFILGTFNTCSIGVSKVCGNPRPDPSGTDTEDVTIAGVVTNTDGGVVDNIALTDVYSGDCQTNTTHTCLDHPSITCTQDSDCAVAVSPTCYAEVATPPANPSLNDIELACGFTGKCTISGATCSASIPCTTGAGSCNATTAPSSVSCSTTHVTASAPICYVVPTVATKHNGGTDNVHATATGVNGGSATPADAHASGCGFSTNPSLEVSKTCQAFLVPNAPAPNTTALVAEVDYTITVTNSNTNLKATNVTVNDPTAGLSGATCGTGTLAGGAFCTVKGTYNPKSLPAGVGTNPVCTNTGGVAGTPGTITNGTQDFFSNTVTASGTYDTFFATSVCNEGGFECFGGTNPETPCSGTSDTTTCTGGGTCQAAACSCSPSGTGQETCTDVASASCPLCPLQSKP